MLDLCNLFPHLALDGGSVVTCGAAPIVDFTKTLCYKQFHKVCLKK